MKDKFEIVKNITKLLSENDCFYVVNPNITANENVLLRDKCFEENVTLIFTKNSFFSKAIENTNIDEDKINEIKKSLHSMSCIMFVNGKYKTPAMIINSFKKKIGDDKIELKCAYLNGDLFLGKESLNEIKNIKTKEEMIRDIFFAIRYKVASIVSSISEYQSLMKN